LQESKGKLEPDFRNEKIFLIAKEGERQCSKFKLIKGRVPSISNPSKYLRILEVHMGYLH
jgi:hypothetical protein